MAACPTKGQLSFLAKNRGNDEDYEGDVGDDDVHGDVCEDYYGDVGDVDAHSDVGDDDDDSDGEGHGDGND